MPVTVDAVPEQSEPPHLGDGLVQVSVCVVPQATEDGAVTVQPLLTGEQEVVHTAVPLLSSQLCPEVQSVTRMRVQVFADLR